MSPNEVPGTTCCEMRRKVLVGVIGVLAAEVCGVPDSAMVDFMRFDIEGPPRTDGKGSSPVIAFKFCPWCGKLRDCLAETRITKVSPPDEESGEEWKQG